MLYDRYISRLNYVANKSEVLIGIIGESAVRFTRLSTNILLEFFILKKLKDTIEFVVSLFYFCCLKLTGKRPARVLIYYHNIKKTDVPGFRRQMGFLAHRCQVARPSEMMTPVTAGNKDVVAITFDDAFVGVKEHAIPILKEFGLTAGISVPAATLEQQSAWEVFDDSDDAGGMVMSAYQLLELDRDGFEIFSHTCSHPVLTEVNDSSLEAELVKSKSLLEGIIGHDIRGISYPYGAYDVRVCRAAEKAGYKLGYTIEPNPIDSTTRPLEIGRFSVLPGDSLMKFKLKTSGAYQITKCLRRLKRLVVKA